MKIMFLNAWGDSMLDALAPYIRENVGVVDVFCFQEAKDYVQAALADVLGDYQLSSTYKYIAEQDDEFNQSTYVRNGIKVVSTKAVLQEDPRCGLALASDVIIDGKRVSICNIHGNARPDDKHDSPGRIAQSRGLIDFYAGTNDPVVIGGDFNILPDIESALMFGQEGYRDLIDEYAIDTTRNHYSWDKYPNKIFYSDYTYVKGPLTVDSFVVPKNEVSDHLPMIIDISLQ